MSSFSRHGAMDQNLDITTKAFNLAESFSNNIVHILSSNHGLKFVKRKTIQNGTDNLEELEKTSRDKWEKLTWFMLNIDNI